MLLGWAGFVPLQHFPVVLNAHAQLQVYGFVAVFTMGIAMMVLPTFLQTKLQQPALGYTSLLLMMTGVLFNLKGPNLVGAACQSLSTLAFLGIIRATRKSAPPAKKKKSPLNREHAAFLASGALWLLASPMLSLINPTRALETVIWGFAGMYIVGIGLRVHTGILGIKGLYDRWLLPSALLWNLAVLLRWLSDGSGWIWLMAAAVGLFIGALRPFRRSKLPPAGGPWLRLFVRTSYLWLVVSVVLTAMAESSHPHFAGPARHALGAGFVLTMIMGMGLRMIPAFQRRSLTWKQSPWWIFVAITAGTLARVHAQATGEFKWLAVAGGFQALAIFTFVLIMVTTILWGRIIECQAPHDAPAFLKDQTS